VTKLLIFSVLAGILSADASFIALSIFKGKKTWKIFSISFVLGFILEFGILYLTMPRFAYWLSGGLVVSVIVVMFSSFLVTLFVGVKNGNDKTQTAGFSILIVGCIILVLLGIISALIVPPAVFANRTWDAMAGLVNIRDPKEEEILATTYDDELLKVSPSQARLEAKGEMPTDVGSYASIGNAFEQTINGQQYYITDLKVSDPRGFRQAGGYLPGYFMREARDIEAETVFVDGFSMIYAPQAWFNKDLRRHVYLNYELYCGNCFVDNLDVLEINEDGEPRYTGTVWEYVIGNRGIKAKEVIVVNPMTGEITPYALNETPEWINRIYSMENMAKLIGWWAKYSEWDAKIISTNLGKMEIDAYEDVYGHNGELQYMFTINSARANDENQANQTLLYDIRVNPRTGEAVKYPASGKTLAAVKDVIDDQTFTEEFNTMTGALPIECERQILLGRMTYFCILQSKSEGEAAEARVGYAFLQEQYTSRPEKVIVADTFNEAWNLLRMQIASDEKTSDIQGEAAQTITVKGILVRKSDMVIEETIWFVVNDGENDLYFRVNSTNPIIGLSKEGDQLEIESFDLRIDNVNDVKEVLNLELPSINN
jgi:hypothetical protein